MKHLLNSTLAISSFHFVTMNCETVIHCVLGVIRSASSYLAKSINSLLNIGYFCRIFTLHIGMTWEKLTFISSRHTCDIVETSIYLVPDWHPSDFPHVQIGESGPLSRVTHSLRPHCKKFSFQKSHFASKILQEAQVSNVDRWAKTKYFLTTFLARVVLPFQRVWVCSEGI